VKKLVLLLFTIFVLFILPSSIYADCVKPPWHKTCGGAYPPYQCTDNEGIRWCCDLPNDECTTPITEAPGPPAEIESVKLPRYTDFESIIGSFRWGDDATLGDIITSLLPLIFVLAGVLLLIYILIGGFTLLTSVGNPKNIQKGQKMLTNGIIGFIIVIVSYWVAQILQTILSINILG
jgi:hypothetical protein